MKKKLIAKQEENVVKEFTALGYSFYQEGGVINNSSVKGNVQNMEVGGKFKKPFMQTGQIVPKVTQTEQSRTVIGGSGPYTKNAKVQSSAEGAANESMVNNLMQSGNAPSWTQATSNWQNTPDQQRAAEAAARASIGPWLKSLASKGQIMPGKYTTPEGVPVEIDKAGNVAYPRPNGLLYKYGNVNTEVEAEISPEINIDRFFKVPARTTSGGVNSNRPGSTQTATRDFYVRFNNDKFEVVPNKIIDEMKNNDKGLTIPTLPSSTPFDFTIDTSTVDPNDPFNERKLTPQDLDRMEVEKATALINERFAPGSDEYINFMQKYYPNIEKMAKVGTNEKKVKAAVNKATKDTGFSNVTQVINNKKRGGLIIRK